MIFSRGYLTKQTITGLYIRRDKSKNNLLEYLLGLLKSKTFLYVKLFHPKLIHNKLPHEKDL